MRPSHINRLLQLPVLDGGLLLFASSLFWVYMLPLRVTRDGAEYAQLFSLREGRSNSSRKIHHEHRDHMLHELSIRDQLLSQLKIQHQPERRAFQTCIEMKYFDDDLSELAPDSHVDSTHHWLIPFPEFSFVGLLPQWTVGDLEFHSCVDWFRTREELCVRPEGAYQRHVISASIQHSVEEYSNAFEKDCGVDDHSRQLMNHNDMIPDLIMGTLAGAGLPHREWSAQPLSLDWQVTDFVPQIPASRLQRLEGCLSRVRAPSQRRSIVSIVKPCSDLVDDGLYMLNDKAEQVSPPAGLCWTRLLPERAGTFAQNCCVDSGILMPDFATSHGLGEGCRCSAILSASTLLDKHSSCSSWTAVVRRDTAGIWTPNAAVLERLVDLQSPWQLLPLPRRAPAPRSKLLVTRAVQKILVPYLQGKRGQKRSLSALMSRDPPYPMVDLSELEADEDSRQAKRRRRAAKRTPSRDLARFVEVATAECMSMRRSEEPIRVQNKEAGEAMQVVAVAHPDAGLEKNTNTPEPAPPHFLQPQISNAGGNAPKFDHRVVLPTRNLQEDVRSALEPVPRLPPPPAPARRTPSPPCADLALPGLSTEGLIEQYMRLQRGESAIAGSAPPGGGSHVHQVTPQRAVTDSTTSAMSSAAVPPVQVSPPAAPNSARSRIAQLAAHNGAHFREAGVRLDVLVSERFLEQQAHAAGELASAFGINLVDCPLEEPLSFILDATTAVCVLSAEALTDRTQLKVLVKQLTGITFKFTKIYLVLTLSSDVNCNAAALQLCQTLMRFPAQVMLRQCTASPTAVAQLIHQLCRHCVRDSSAAGPDATSAKYLHRPFIDQLQRAEGNFLSHCEYLQRFPTVNFFFACALLHHFPLRALLRQTPAAVCGYLRAQHVCTGETEVMVASFLQLVGTHAGLGACV